MKTIFALATPPGRSGVAVIRISGSRASHALIELGIAPLPAPRMATLATLLHPTNKAALDKALVLWFPAPASFTGEDVAELHLHGSQAVIRSVIDALSGIEGLRLAEPGEFSRQAFANGKFDLTQAEGLADLIDAQTEAQRRQAMRQMQGHLRELYDGFRTQTIRSLAFIEAYIDFPDEEIPPSVTEQIHGEITTLIDSITRHLSDNRSGERIREGLYAVIIGPPNAGKSSLLNYLAKREAAIVSATAGTTRDIIEVQLDIDGYPLTLADTAGLRETSDEIENEGIRRALERASHADIKIAIFDITTLHELDQQTLDMVGESPIILLNKVDSGLCPPSLPPALAQGVPVSITSNLGIDAFTIKLKEHIQILVSPSDNAVITRARHRVALENTVIHLKNYLSSSAIELACEELRRAAVEIGSITGIITVEDVLDELFSNFCIGK